MSIDLDLLLKSCQHEAPGHREGCLYNCDSFILIIPYPKLHIHGAHMTYKDNDKPACFWLFWTKLCCFHCCLYDGISLIYTLPLRGEFWFVNHTVHLCSSWFVLIILRLYYYTALIANANLMGGLATDLSSNPLHRSIQYYLLVLFMCFSCFNQTWWKGISAYLQLRALGLKTFIGFYFSFTFHFWKCTPI